MFIYKMVQASETIRKPGKVDHSDPTVAGSISVTELMGMRDRTNNNQLITYYQHVTHLQEYNNNNTYNKSTILPD